HNQCGASCIAEEFSDSSAGEGCEELQRSGIRCRSRYNNSIRHSSSFFQCFHYTGNSRSFLSDSYIDTIYRLACIVKLFLVDDSIHTDSSFTSLAITNLKFSLSTTDRNHSIYSFDTCLHRFFYRLTEDNPRGFTFQRHVV